MFRHARSTSGEVRTQLLRPGATVLELGCGTGRLTAQLLSAGCAMTAVDNSDEMLAYVPSGAHAVKADIEELRLPATFDVVLLASRLINHEDHDVRAAFIRTAAMHLTHLGKFVLERHWACASLGNPLDPSIEWTA